MYTLSTVVLLMTASCAVLAINKLHPPPSRLSASRSSAPAPSPIPFPYIPSPAVFIDEDYEGDEYYVDDEEWLPELPFEYHHPTDDSMPADFFPWAGLYKTPNVFWGKGEEIEEMHKPTPVLIINPELENRLGPYYGLETVKSRDKIGICGAPGGRNTSPVGHKSVAESVHRRGSGNVERSSGISTAEQPASEHKAALDPDIR